MDIKLDQYLISELFQIRDALKVLEGLGLRNKELMQEVEEEIQKKSAVS